MSDLTDFPAPLDTVLLDRVLAGQGSADDQALVRAWAARDPGNEAVRHVLAHLRQGVRGPASSPSVDAAWERLRATRLHRVAAAVQSGDTHPETVSERANGMRATSRRMATWVRTNPRTRRWTLPIAVAVLLAVIVGGITVRGHAHGPSDAPQSWTTYATATGQVAHLTLRDGTHVVLAPATQLLVPSDFGGEQRAVRLTGEAYFDVARVTGAPFSVRTGSVRTNVLGTTFDVTHYPDDADVRVAVTSGKVSVGTEVSRRPSITLTAGAVGHVTDSTATVTLLDNVSDVSGWTGGHLVFRRAPVSEVLATVGRWYGYQFRLADSALAVQHITATLDYDARAEVLTSLKALLEVSMTFDGNVITLHSWHPGDATPAPPRTHEPRNSMSTVKEVGR
jgi:ferric-dicitrate binding protein FerR (iron transport regulator)